MIRFKEIVQTAQFSPLTFKFPIFLLRILEHAIHFILL